ncbi:MAG: CdaR family protein [Bacilli bacterium]|nr:CdaR family protein [Bacilli bacterium]MDD4607945.1 CdaR family protein [Bacilli bacterium]
MKTIAKIIKNFVRRIGKFVDTKIINPITKLVLAITGKFEKSGKRFENWLSKTNTLLYISLFLAIIIFIVIDQKIITFTESSAEVLKSQPVSVIYNEEAYVIEGLPETVDITLIGSKTDLFIAKQSPSYDIQIDLTGLKPGTHKVNIKYSQVLTNLEYMVNPSVATVIIYDKVSKSSSLTVDVLNQDSLDEKLVIENVKLDTDKVVIKGAEYQLERVANVKALVDINNLVKQEVGTHILKNVPLRAYDQKGNVVDIEIVPSEITAEIEITSPSKEIPIKVVPTGNVAFGKAISSIEASSSKVTVYGPEDVLDKLNYIPLEIDVTNLKADKQWKLELIKPVGVKSMSVNSITVDIKLDSVTDMDIKNVKIERRNLNDNYNVSAASADDIAVTVNIKGVESVLKDITADDIVAYVDLKGLGEGTHEVEVMVEGSDPRIEYLSKTKKITLRIIKK